MGTNIVPISALPETLDPLNGDEDLPIVQGGVTKRIKTFRALAFTLPEWRSDVIYAENAVITYNGNLWRSLTGSNVGNTPSSASEYWIQTAVTPNIDIQGDNLNHADGRFVRLNGQTFYEDWATYGHRLTIIDPVSMTIVSSAIYGTFSGTASLITALNAVPGNYVVTLVSCGQITIDGALRTALAARGGRSAGAPGSGAISHVFIGQAGLQPGEGYEVYDTTASLRQQCYVSETGIVKQGKEGPIGNPVIVQGSVDASAWHTGLLTGDVYMRTSEDNGATWSDAVRILGEDGESGKFTNFKFAKNTSQSTPPSYTANADNPGSNWFDGPQTLSGGEFQWFIKSNWRDTVRLDNWTAPVRLSGETGATGAAGTNNAMVLLYKRSASAPTKPSTSSTFTFSTGVLTGHDNGWTQAIPAVNGQPCWVIAASASSNTATDTILPSEWSDQVKMVEDGTDGTNGLNSATVKLYKLAGSSPAVPTTTSTYTFSTGVLTGHDNGWTQSEPAEGTASRWVISAVAVSSGATDDILTSEWSTPVRYLGPPSIYPSDTALSFRLPLSDMPELPDNAAGTAYRSDFGTSVDGFIGTNATLTAVSGSLRIDATTTDPYITRAVSFIGPRFVIVRFRQLSGALGNALALFGTGGSNKNVSYAAAGLGIWQTVAIDTTTMDVGSWLGVAQTAFRIDLPNNAPSLPCQMEIGAIYMGDGTYAPRSPGYSRPSWSDYVAAGVAGANATLALSGSALQVTATTTDPYVYWSVSPFSGSANPFVRVAVRQTSGALGGAVAISANGTISKNLAYTNPGLGIWTILTFDMRTPDAGTWLGATISSLRIDAPNNAPSLPCVYEIGRMDISDGVYGPVQDTSPSAIRLSCQPGAVRTVGPVGAPAVKCTFGGLRSDDESALPKGAMPFGLASWFKLDSLAALSRIFYFGSATSGLGCRANITTTGALNLSNVAAAVVSAAGTVSVDNKWHRFGARWDGTTTTLFLDGVPVFSAAQSFNIGSGLGINYGQNNVGAENFLGELAGPKIWNRAPTDAEFLGDYAQTPAPDAKATEVAVVQKAPKYLGKWLDTAPTPGNVGDTYTRYSTTSGSTNRGVFRWNGVTWDRTEAQADIRQAGSDIAFIIAYKNTAGAAIYGTAADYSGDSTVQADFGFFQSMFVGYMEAHDIKVRNSFRGGDRYNADGSLADGTKNGAHLKDGILTVAGIRFEGSQGGGVQWSGGQQIGSSLSISGAINPYSCALNSTTIAVADATLGLRTYSWSGSAWSQVGSALAGVVGGTHAYVCALSSTQIALVDDFLGKLRTYSWSGSAWSLVGSAFTLPDSNSGLKIASINSTTIAIIGFGSSLRTYSWSGSAWSMVGSALAVQGDAIASLNSTQIAVADDAANTLTTYSWSGSAWSQVGSSLTISGMNYPTLAALNGTDVVLFDYGNASLRLYRFDGATWSLISSAGSIGTSGAAVVGIAALNGTDIGVTDGQTDQLRTYRWSFSLSIPYSRQITG